MHGIKDVFIVLVCLLFTICIKKWTEILFISAKKKEKNCHAENSYLNHCVWTIDEYKQLNFIFSF